MDIQLLTRFFMWCTILNGGLLMITAFICMFAGDWAYKKQARLFAISRETFDIATYSFIALFKLFLFVFNLVPYIALLILG